MQQNTPQRFQLDLARLFNNGVAVRGPAVTLLSAWVKRLEFVLEYEKRPLDLTSSSLFFELHTKRGERILSLPYVGDTGWELERPQSGRISWLIDGKDSGFDVVFGVAPEAMEWRVRGDLQGLRNVTAILGQFHYRRSGSDPTDDDDEDEGSIGLDSNLELELQYRVQYPLYYTTFEFDTDELLVRKVHWSSPDKRLRLFTIDYAYTANELLASKAVTRNTDGKRLVITYAYDANDLLSSKTRTRF